MNLIVIFNNTGYIKNINNPKSEICKIAKSISQGHLSSYIISNFKKIDVNDNPFSNHHYMYDTQENYVYIFDDAGRRVLDPIELLTRRK